MMRIMARRMKATTERMCRSKSRANLRQRLIQAKVRSTIQRLGSTSKRGTSLRLTISNRQAPIPATHRYRLLVLRKQRTYIHELIVTLSFNLVNSGLRLSKCLGI